MATLTKRKNKDGTFSYRAVLRERGRATQSKSFPSAAARAAWVKETELVALGTAGKDKTLGDLVMRYGVEESVKKKGSRWERLRIARFACPVKEGAEPDPLALVRLRDLDSTAIAEWRDRRLKAVSAATVGREWTLYSQACRVAVEEWKWLPSNPFAKAAGARRPPEPKGHRTRLATDDELARIAAQAKHPTEVKVILAARFAVETAMRAGEILGLTADRVDTERRVARLVDTWSDRGKNGGRFTSIKTGANRDVPLTAEAVRIWEEAGGKGFDLNPQTRDVYWRAMRERAGVPDLRFHDLRHTAITRLAKRTLSDGSRLSVLELARITGHKRLDELMTYYNETAEDVARRL